MTDNNALGIGAETPQPGRLNKIYVLLLKKSTDFTSGRGVGAKSPTHETNRFMGNAQIYIKL